MTIEETIYNEVKNRCELPTNAYGIGAWDHHIKIVYELAKKYASEYGASIEIVALAALLHDIASVTDVSYTEEHHIIGSQIAEELLLKEKYPEDKIELIKKCILNHRGSKLAEKTTPEEICIADSDAMAHFYSIPSLLSMVYREKSCLLMMEANLLWINLIEVITRCLKKEKCLLENNMILQKMY